MNPLQNCPWGNASSNRPQESGCHSQAAGRCENMNSFLHNNHGLLQCRERVSGGEESFYLNQYPGVIFEGWKPPHRKEDLTLTPLIPVQFQAASHFFVPIFAEVMCPQEGVGCTQDRKCTQEDAESKFGDRTVLRTAHRPERQRLWL